MRDRWRKKPESESKPDEMVEAESVDADLATTGPESESASAPEASNEGDGSQTSPSTGRAPEEPGDEAQPSEPRESATVGPPAEAATRPIDEFDVLGVQIADVLRQAHAVADRVQAEASEQARATTADAEQQARELRSEVQREIQQQRAESIRQLEEAASVLEAGQKYDRTLRRNAEQHLADAAAARASGRAILQHATEQLARADTAAQSLAAQIEAASLESGQIAAELRTLVEQLSPVVQRQEAPIGPHAGTDDDSSVIDLRDSSGSSSDESSAEGPNSDQAIARGDDSPDEDAEPTVPAEAAEQP